jgi:uncharacterized RDD family membrane protein YckC
LTPYRDEPSLSDAPAGLLRRLAALCYDLLLLVAVLFVVTLVVLFARGGREISPGTWWFELSLVAVSAAFFIWFWTHGGQTLGMRAWQVRVVDRVGGPIGLKRAVVRYVAAVASALPAGLGFWWSLVDRENLCWHDRWSGTKLVRVRRAPPVNASD